MFQQALGTAQGVISAFLAEELARFGVDRVAAGMRYATDGGKRLRGFLALESAAVFDVAPERAIHAAGAIECLHAYSLVHDDLPCMDDDDLRRGRPTVHVKWDEATAVLVGDALQSFAFDLLSDPRAGDAGQRVALIAALARAAGADGMVLGQAQDIAAGSTSGDLSLAHITELQGNKTGRLIEWPAEAGAILGGADPAPLRAYARAVGLAFQIADDVLDVEGDAATAGKALQKDAEAGKATFVSHLGLDGAKARAAELVDAAEAALAPYGKKAHNLAALARYIVERDK